MTLDVYGTIKRKIITLEIKPGETLKEKDLSAELKTGRTPVREALLMLKADNLVESRPNGVPYVKYITLKGARDLFVPFLTVERLVMRLAAQKMTPDRLAAVKAANLATEEAIAGREHWNIMAHNRRLHSTIGLATDNEYVIDIYETLLNQQERLSYLAVTGEIKSGLPLPDHLALIGKQHRDILAALESGDPERAENLADDHIRLFQQRITSYLSQP